MAEDDFEGSGVPIKDLILVYCDNMNSNYLARGLSISRFVFSLDSGAISWSSKKQPIVTLSSIEAEYKGGLWLHVKPHG